MSLGHTEWANVRALSIGPRCSTRLIMPSRPLATSRDIPIVVVGGAAGIRGWGPEMLLRILQYTGQPPNQDSPGPKCHQGWGRPGLV